MSSKETTNNETDAPTPNTKSDDFFDEPVEWVDITPEQIEQIKSDEKLAGSVKANVDVKLTPKHWQQSQSRKELYGWDETDLTSYLLDYVLLEFRFTVDGEEVHRSPGYDDENPG